MGRALRYDPSDNQNQNNLLYPPWFSENLGYASNQTFSTVTIQGHKLHCNTVVLYFLLFWFTSQSSSKYLFNKCLKNIFK